MYPERRGDKFERSWGEILMGRQGKEPIERFRCEQNVYKCVQSSPLVKLMMGALKSSGCEIDIRRHIACEVCDESVSGGYDPVLNQVVVCQNIAKSEGMVQGVLVNTDQLSALSTTENDRKFPTLGSRVHSHV